MHPFESITLSACFTYVFGGQSLLLAIPAVVSAEAYDVVCELPLVRNVLDRPQRANVVITPITAADPTQSTVVRQNLTSADNVRYAMQKGAVGEIGSFWWFDKMGRQVDVPEARPIGLGLKGLADIVRDDRMVVAVVAASRARVGPLKVALEQELVNVLITDSVTAQALLEPERRAGR
jgi:DNA-binding transcriptional regulator LsrR (DeoR family)